MTESRAMMSARKRGRGSLPGMAPAVSAPPSLDEPTAQREGETPKARNASPASITFGGALKVTVSTRTYRPLWDAYNDLALELTREGRGRVFQNDLINAVLAVCLPADAQAARERLSQYRAMLEADPPRDLRTLS